MIQDMLFLGTAHTHMLNHDCRYKYTCQEIVAKKATYFTISLRPIIVSLAIE